MTGQQPRYHKTNHSLKKLSILTSQQVPPLLLAHFFISQICKLFIVTLPKPLYNKYSTKVCTIFLLSISQEDLPMSDKTVVLNAKKMNFDGNLDFSVLSSDVTVYDDTTPEQLLERIEGADIIVTKEMPVNGDLIRKFPASVKLICEAGTGYNNLDLDAAREKGITVCNIPAYSSERVAHTAIMMILNLSSTMQVQMKMLANGNHDNFTKNLQVPHVEVNGKTLGIIGAGHIGKTVMKIAKALDMNILVYTRTPRADEDGIRYVDLETVLKNSDYVSLHCPLTPQTKHMINKETLALIDEPALIEALEKHQIAGAGLDVQETEPPKADNPLYTLDNVILTPHMGWKGLETRQRLVSILAGNVKGFLEGKPVNVVS